MLAAGSRYSAHTADERRDIEAACRAVTSTFYDDLDLSAEIRTVAARNLGDTLLLWDESPRAIGEGRAKLVASGFTSNSVPSDREPVPMNVSTHY